MTSIDLWYATRATGIVALVLLTATVFLGVLVAGRARSHLPAFARVRLHRDISLLTLVFLAVHIITSVVDSYVNIGWPSVLVPFTSSYHRYWLALGTIGVDLLLAVALSSLLRHHIPARLWRSLHWLAYLSWPVAVSHTLGMGSDARFTWAKVLVAVCSAAVVGAGAWRLATTSRARAARPLTATAPRAALWAGVPRPGPLEEAA